MDRDAPRAERRRLTHVDRRGRPRMVDVSAKPPTARRAVAEAEVAVAPETLSLVIDGGGSKGDVLTVAELAGKVHRDLEDTVKSARVWGSGAFDGQTVGRDHVLKDKDVVELHV